MPVSNCTVCVALPRICHGMHKAGGRQQRYSVFGGRTDEVLHCGWSLMLLLLFPFLWGLIWLINTCISWVLLFLLMVLEGHRDASSRGCCWDCCRLVWDCRDFWDFGLLRGIDAPPTYLAKKKRNNFVLFSISSFETFGHCEAGKFPSFFFTLILRNYIYFLSCEWK